MRAEGHQIGNHTYSHVRLLKAEKDAVVEEIHKTETRVVADLVALRPHPPEKVLVAGHLLPDDEEGSRRAPLQQAVQQPPGGVRPSF